MVYCNKCRHVFPEYKEVGQQCKDAVKSKLAIIAGKVVLVWLSGGLVTPILMGDFEAIIDIPNAVKILDGNRRNALNVAKFPCPVCRGYSHWKRGENDKESVIRPGELNWKGEALRLGSGH